MKEYNTYKKTRQLYKKRVTTFKKLNIIIENIKSKLYLKKKDQIQLKENYGRNTDLWKLVGSIER